MHTGTQARIGVVPKLGSIKDTVSLSKTAKQRLKWIDYYIAHSNNARLSCRHFGIGHDSGCSDCRYNIVCICHNMYTHLEN